MTADEMFENLGYVKNDKLNNMIIYDYAGNFDKFKNGKEKKYRVYGTDKRIVFFIKSKEIDTYSPVLREDYEDCSILLNIQELQAINKKCEELQWL